VVPLAGAIGTYGLTMAFQLPTMSLFLADDVHAAPLLIGLFYVIRGVMSIGVSQGTGRLSDRLRDRRLMLGLSGAAGVAAGLCFALVRDYVVLVTVGLGALSISMVPFSQLFAYASEYATARGQAVTAFTTVMRSVFSAAWVVGPPLGLFIAARYGFGPLYLATAGLSLAMALIGRWGLRYVPVPQPTAVTPADEPASPAASPRRRLSSLALPPRLWLLLGAILAMGMANQAYGIDISLYVTKDLHLPTQLVGWMAGLTAAVEVPVMIAAGRVADRLGKGRVVLAAMAVATAVFCLLPLATSAAALLGLMVLNGTWGAIALSIPMIMVQEEGQGGAGAALSLYNSAFTISILLAGAITGVTASAVGYGGVLWVCAGLTTLAGVALAARVAAPARDAANAQAVAPAQAAADAPRTATPGQGASLARHLADRARWRRLAGPWPPAVFPGPVRDSFP
jgi:SET family sugar efflux transporter-like MFS transporter